MDAVKISPDGEWSVVEANIDRRTPLKGGDVAPDIIEIIDRSPVYSGSVKLKAGASSKRTASEVIDLTNSDDDEPAPKRLAIARSSFID